MKKMLLILFIFSTVSFAFSQNPVIDGDILLCPYDEYGTVAVTNATYDTYQWYFRAWGESEFTLITGATDSSFTFDYYTYGLSDIKVIVTLGTDTLESNIVLIDARSWLPIYVQIHENEYVTFNFGEPNYMLCEGYSFGLTIGDPFDANIEWYRDGNLIPGATSQYYEITEAGVYHAEAAFGPCPESRETTPPVSVGIDQNCSLGINDLLHDSISIYPNPVLDALILDIKVNSTVINKYSILDITGKLLVEEQVIFESNATINVGTLPSGLFLLVLESETGNLIHKFVKE